MDAQAFAEWLQKAQEAQASRKAVAVVGRKVLQAHMHVIIFGCPNCHQVMGLSAPGRHYCSCGEVLDVTS